MLMALTGTLACSAGEGRPEQVFELIDENGVPTAVNSGGPRYGGDIFRYEKVLEIRPDTAVEESFLYDPQTFVMDENGTVYVGEQRNFRVSVWEDGRYVRSIGRQGEGPGEFPFGPVSPMFLDGNVLSIPLLQNGRTLRFRTDGAYVDTLSPPTRRPGIQAIHETRGGLRVMIEHISEPAGALDHYGMRATVVGADDVIIATLDTPLTESVSFGGFGQIIFVPPDRLLLSTGLEPVVDEYDLDGRLQRRVRIDLPREEVSDVEREEIIGYLRQLLDEAPDEADPSDPGRRPKRYWSRRLERLRFPEHKAHWSGVVVSDSGFIWLAMPLPERFDYSANVRFSFRILSLEGEYLGDTSPPEIFAPVAAQHSHLLAFVIDADSGERVPTVFRVVPAIDGLEYR